MRINFIQGLRENQKLYRRYEILLKRFMILMGVIHFSVQIFAFGGILMTREQSQNLAIAYNIVLWVTMFVTYVTISALMKQLHHYEYNKNRKQMWQLWLSLQVFLAFDIIITILGYETHTVTRYDIFQSVTTQEFNHIKEQCQVD